MENEKKEIKLHSFDDLCDCTEYYYEELGKLDAFAAEKAELSKKEKKRIHSIIMKFFYYDLNIVDKKRNTEKFIDKTELKEFNKTYKKEHKGLISRSFKKALSFPKKLINIMTKGKKYPEIEIVEEPKRLENITQELKQGDNTDTQTEYDDDTSSSA